MFSQFKHWSQRVILKIAACSCSCGARHLISPLDSQRVAGENKRPNSSFHWEMHLQKPREVIWVWAFRTLAETPKKINKTHWEERKRKCDWLRRGFGLSGCSQVITSSASTAALSFPPPFLSTFPTLFFFFFVFSLPSSLSLTSSWSLFPLHLVSVLSLPTCKGPDKLRSCQYWPSLWKTEHWNVNQSILFLRLLHFLAIEMRNSMSFVHEPKSGHFCKIESILQKRKFFISIGEHRSLSFHRDASLLRTFPPQVILEWIQQALLLIRSCFFTAPDGQRRMAEWHRISGSLLTTFIPSRQHFIHA